MLKNFCVIGLIFLTGCATTNLNPPNWDNLAPRIQARVRTAASLAFTMEKIKQYKPEVCLLSSKIADYLERLPSTLQGREITFDQLREMVLAYVDKIVLDAQVRQAVRTFVDIALTEAANYAQSHYQDLVNSDQMRAVLLVSGAVAHGITDACAN